MKARHRGRSQSWPRVVAAAVVAVTGTVAMVGGMVDPSKAATVIPQGPMQSIESGYLVNGDVLSVGNGSLWCDPALIDPELDSNVLCPDLHTGSEPNNDVMMVNRDTDSDPSTFNSTSASITIPNGAKVARAWMFWSANGYSASDDPRLAQCDGGNLLDPNRNSPAERHVAMADVAAQRPLMRVDGGGYQQVPAADYTALYTPPEAAHEQRIHAAVDVTDILRAELPDGTHRVTVANLLGSQGYSCSAGWVLHVSYDYGTYIPGNADSQSRMVYTDFGLDRVRLNSRTSTFDGFKTAAPGATFLVTATEGDSSSPRTGYNYNQDTARVTWAGGSAAVENARGNTVNVFRSLAEGNLSYFPGVSDADFFNGSVDTFTYNVSGLPTGTTSVDFTYRSTADDGYFPQALTLAVPVASIDIDKTAVSGDDYQFVPIGQRPQYRLTLRNTSSVALSQVTFEDALAETCTLAGTPLTKTGDVFSAPALAAGDSVEVECEGAPVAAGDPAFVNTAIARAEDPNGDPVPEAEDDTPVHPTGVQLRKTAEPAVVPVGGDVTWTMTATNIGGTPLTDVALTDDDCAGTVSAPSGPNAPASLAPGDTWTYTCAEPLDEGKTNRASVTAVPTAVDPATGTPVRGAPVRDADQAEAAVAGLSVVKSTNGEDANQAPGPQVKVGDPVTWTYVVTNTGEVPVHDVSVTDDQGVVVPALPATGDTDGDGVLDVGETWTYEATGTATSGQYRNVGTVVGTYDDDNDPGTPLVALDPATDPSHYFGVDAGLALDKRVVSVTDVNGNGLTDAGDEIRWEFELSNTGNVSLSDLKVDDPLAGAVTCPAGVVAPGASVVCTADEAYVITLADVEAGSVVNVATARGEAPGGDPSDPADDVPSNEDETETPTDAVPGLSLDKRVVSVTDVNGNGLTDAGDEIRWEFELSNTGNVSLSDLKVDDEFLADAGIDVTCPTAPLAPADTVVCTADSGYVITAADVRAGEVHNVATATGTGPRGPVPSDPDETRTPTGEVDGITDPGTPPTGGSVLPENSALPNTGGPSAWWMGLGLLLVLLGSGAVVGGRRVRVPAGRA